MTELKPPVASDVVLGVAPRERPAKDPITEGVQARLRHFREVADAFSTNLREMERLEKLLFAALDRFDGHVSLMGTDIHFLEALLKRDTSKPKAPGASIVPFVDHVEEALQTLTSGMKAS